MTQIENRFDIQNSINDEEKMTITRKLPNFFDSNDELSPINSLSGSLIAHVLFVFILLLLAQYSKFFTAIKPPLPKHDLEFKLVQAPEKPPINKNTKIRSDRNSQAGGIHDPKRIVSEPSPSAKPQAKPAQAQPKAQPKPQPPKQVQQPQKPIQKPVFKPAVAQKPTPAKPSPIQAPSAVKPAFKPSPSAPSVKPQAPKIATAPKSPFQVAAPTVKAPVGNTYKPQGAPQGGSSASGSSTGAPAPKFSSSTGSKVAAGGSGSAGSIGSKAAPRGTGGYGTGSNPSPGNPNGRPGIDAIKQPNWGPYMRDLEQRIKRNWSPPKGDTSKRVIITFTIGRDGRLLSRQVTKSSGSPLADRAALSAIELTAPFRPLPPEFKGTSVPIEFTFDYNVLNSAIK